MLKPSAVKWVIARFPGKCPQCKRPIVVGDKVGQPQSKNSSGGRSFIAAWYCPMDAEILALNGDSAPFLTLADRDAFAAERSKLEAEIRARYGAK